MTDASSWWFLLILYARTPLGGRPNEDFRAFRTAHRVGLWSNGEEPWSALGHKRKLRLAADGVRSSSESRHRRARMRSRLSATCRHPSCVSMTLPACFING